jgi:hypothetical protein
MSNALEMSDEDFLNSPPEATVEIEEEEEVVTEAPEETPEEEFETEEEVDEEQEEVAEDDSEEEDAEEELDSTEDTPDTTDTYSTNVEEANKVFQPFKANGGDVQVKNADEAIKLMQMGANYTKKMQALQPNLKVLKMLEQQDLLSEEKLSFLIDLNKKDPKAIAKLVKDSEIDPLSLEPEEGEEYVPQNYSVPDEAMQLEQVLSEIESTPTYSKCIDVVGNQWDDSSKQVLSQNPLQIKQLNEQMSAGIFDQIMSEVDRLKMFGGLSGLSDFDAYKQVGTNLFQSGQLANVPKPKAVGKTQVAAKPQDNARTLKRRAASSPKNSKKSATSKADFNPLNMSDEEFEKIVNQQRK